MLHEPVRHQLAQPVLAARFPPRRLGGAGVPELVAAIAQFRAYSGDMQATRRKTRSEYRLRELVAHRFMEHLERKVLKPGELAEVVDRIAAREVDPYTAAADLLGRALQLPNYQLTKLPNL